MKDTVEVAPSKIKRKEGTKPQLKGFRDMVTH